MSPLPIVSTSSFSFAFWIQTNFGGMQIFTNAEQEKILGRFAVIRIFDAYCLYIKYGLRMTAKSLKVSKV